MRARWARSCRAGSGGSARSAVRSETATTSRRVPHDLVGDLPGVDHDDLFDGAEIDRRAHGDLFEEVLPFFRLDDRADGDALRVDAVDAGGEDGVARLDV